MLNLLVVGLVAVTADANAGGEAKPRTTIVNALRGWFEELPEPRVIPTGVIKDEAEWKRFWAKAKLPGKRPEVDFRQEVVVVGSQIGWSRLWAGYLKVEVDGKARVEWLSNPDRIPGSYGILVFPRRGLRSIGGRELWP